MQSKGKFEERAKRIWEYYLRHSKDRKRTCEHFQDEGLSKRTVYHILRKYEQQGDATSKKPIGRPPTVCTEEMFSRVSQIFRENPNLSCREAALQLGIKRTTIFRIMEKMRERDLPTNKILERQRRCPTCHQKIDSNVILTKTSTTKTNQ